MLSQASSPWTVKRRTDSAPAPDGIRTAIVPRIVPPPPSRVAVTFSPAKSPDAERVARGVTGAVVRTPVERPGAVSW